MSGDLKKHAFYIVLTAFILVSVFLLLFNRDNFVGSFNMDDFQWARYLVNHPKQILSISGSPFHTLLLAPFSVFGYLIAKGFNLILGVAAIVLTAKVSGKIAKGSSVYAIALAATAPAYFFLMGTCLPEVLLSLLLILALYLFWENELLFAAIILSFAPFVRAEAATVLPVFALAYLLKRDYRSMAGFLVAPVVFMLGGLFAFGDLFLFFPRAASPIDQVVANEIVKTGAKYLFVGIPLLLLSIVGLVSWLGSFGKNFSLKTEKTIHFLVVPGSLIVFLVASFSLGKNFSLATGAVVPLIVLVSLKGIDLIRKVSDKKVVVSSIVFSLIVAQFALFFVHSGFPIKSQPEDELIRKSARYVGQADYAGKIFYFDPEILFQMRLDPLNDSISRKGITDRNQPSNDMQWGDLLIWDSNYGGKVGIPAENLEKDPFLKKMEAFCLKAGNDRSGDAGYCIQIYKKSASKTDSVIVSDSYTRTLDFASINDSHVIEVDQTKAWKFDNTQEYGPTVTLSPDVVKRYETLEFEVILDYKSLSPLDHNQAYLVFSAESDAQKYHYESVELVSDGTRWEQKTMKVKLPGNTPATKILVYFFNKDRKDILMKNLSVQVKSY